MGHRGNDGGGVHAAAQEGPERDVADHAAVDRAVDGPAQFLRCRRRRQVPALVPEVRRQIPIAPDPRRLTGLANQGMARQEPGDAAEQGPLAERVVEGQIVTERDGVDGAPDPLVQGECCGFRCEQELVGNVEPDAVPQAIEEFLARDLIKAREAAPEPEPIEYYEEEDEDE